MARGFHLFHVEELVVAQRPVDGFVEDFHVGQPRQKAIVLRASEFACERVDLLAQCPGTGGKFAVCVLGNRDAGGRKTFGGWRRSLRGEVGGEERERGDTDAREANRANGGVHSGRRKKRFVLRSVKAM